MIVPYYVVDLTTGEIVRSGQVNEHLIGYFDDGDHEGRAGFADGETNYVDLNTGAVLDKQTLDPDIDTNGYEVTISPTPRPCTITVDGGEPTTDSDGSVTINFGGAGTYQVKIAAVGFYDWVQEITV